jgi:ABC-type bacteriocin/lantibiotic exporter with double-glycine peptidase domain
VNRTAWSYYLGLYRGSYGSLAEGIILSIVQSAVLVPVFLLVRFGVDVLIPQKRFTQLLLAGAAILAAYVIHLAVSLRVRYVILRVTKEAVQLFRVELLKKFYAFSRTYYGRADRARLHSVVVQDTQRLDVMSNALIGQAIPSSLVCATLGVAMAVQDLFLFVVLMCLFPFSYLLSRVTRRMMVESVNRCHRDFEAFSKGVLFVLRHMDFTRIQASEEYELSRQSEKMADVTRTSGLMAWLQTLYARGNNFITAFAGVLLLMVGGHAVISGRMSIGGLLSFYVAVGLMKDSLRGVFEAIPQILEGNESMNELYGLIRDPDVSPYSGKGKPEFRGGVELRNVSFTYGEKLILDHVSLEINPGETVAIIGPNGIGKSTITYLILGFHGPASGELFAGGFSYSGLDMAHLRRGMGVVTQDPVIIEGTILDNITYGAPDVPMSRVVEAAGIATADEFIRRLPLAFDTMAGENGMLLSGGQCQRIAIARALLRKPKLLILDEPTNHLDQESIAALMANLAGMDESPAILIISHDMEIVKGADRIYTLHEGHIVRLPGRGAPLSLSSEIPAGACS